MTRRSMGQHATNGACRQKLARDAAENPFTQSAVPIAASHDEICLFLLHNVQELGGGRVPRSAPDFGRHDHPVADKISSDISEILLGLRLRFVLADFDEQDLFGL